MSPTPATFDDVVRALVSPDTAQAALALKDAPAPKDAPVLLPPVNAHVHLPPNFSAFDTIVQALDLAQAQNVRVLGASNYYDYGVYADFAREALARGIFPLFGLEIIALVDELVQGDVRVNDPGNPGKYYLCGKGISRFAPMDDEAQKLLQTIRDNDSQRMAAMASRLAQVFSKAGVDTGLDADAVKARVARRHECAVGSVYLQERHLAQAFQEALFEQVPADARAAVLERAYGVPAKAPLDDAVGVQNDIRSFLMKAGKPAFAPDTFVDFGHARRLVLALGGLLCYPMLADGTVPLTGYEADLNALVADLRTRGVLGVELIPPRNSPEALLHIVPALRAAGLFVTAGTEHNTLDLIPLTPRCFGDVPVPETVQAIFWEGACVLAAHQTLGMQGKPAFADAQGVPNPAYDTPDARIRAFATQGATLLARYQELAAERV